METLGLIALVAVSFCVYFLPTGFAYSYKKRSTGAIFVINLFLGRTIVGRIIALAWSVVKDK